MAAGDIDSHPGKEKESILVKPRNFKDLTVKTNLADLYSNAVNAGNPQDLVTSIRIASTCLKISTLAPSQERLRVSMPTPQVNESEILALAVSAYGSLQAMCSTGDSAELLDQIKSRKRGGVGKLYGVMLAGKKAGDDVFFQAATQVLSVPANYSVEFEVWLDRQLPRLVGSQLSDKELSVAQAELWARFIGNASTDSIFEATRCAVNFLCSKAIALDTSESARINSVVNDVERNIREQRWAAILR